RQLNDPELLWEMAGIAAMPGFCSTVHQPETLRLVEEMAGWAREGVAARTLRGALANAQGVYLEYGDRARAEGVWKELDALAERTRDPELLLWPLEREAIEATLDGSLEAAVAAAGRLVPQAEEQGAS